MIPENLNRFLNYGPNIATVERVLLKAYTSEVPPVGKSASDVYYLTKDFRDLQRATTLRRAQSRLLINLPGRPALQAAEARRLRDFSLRMCRSFQASTYDLRLATVSPRSWLTRSQRQGLRLLLSADPNEGMLAKIDLERAYRVFFEGERYCDGYDPEKPTC